MLLPGFLRRLFGASGPQPRPEIDELATVAPRRGAFHARYAAADDDEEMASHWAQADAYDADLANSLSRRKRLRERSRLEQANNGYAAGIIRTDANYVIGRGPMLQMQTGSPGFNAMIEDRWRSWCRVAHLARKLRTMCKAKRGDGEAFLMIVRNPNLNHAVKLDVRGIECDQVTTPLLPYGDPQHIDGVRFDEFGNPTVYEVLPYHPGSQWSGWMNQEPQQVPAEWMLHWFTEDRPGQHRGIPEITSTLKLFGKGRRYREAVIASAEIAADFAAMLETAAPNDGPDEVRPFSTLPIERGMLVATPAGSKMNQFKPEQPATTYAEFNRSIVSEEARPLSMSYSIAACDSSGNSFSGTQNDHLVYYQSVDAERADCEELVLDKLFAAWFQLAAATYVWSVPAEPAPRHGWTWPPMPQVEADRAATADQGELALGIPPSVIAARRGADFEDWVEAAAQDYGVTVAEIKSQLFASNFQKPGAAAPSSPDSAAEPAADMAAISRSRLILPSRNGGR